MLKMYLRAIGLIGLIGVLIGCGSEPEEQARQESPPVLVTSVKAKQVLVERIQKSVGRIISKGDPVIATEASGQVVKIHVDVGNRVEEGALLAVIDPKNYQLTLEGAVADVEQVKARIVQQRRLVHRYELLVDDKFFSENTLDEAKTQLKSLEKQLDAARSRSDQARRNLGRTQVRSPVSGVVQQRLANKGDYVSVGTPLFRLSTRAMLQIILPFPEGVAEMFHIGQTVRLWAPTAPDEPVETRITDIRPAIWESNRAVEVIVDMANPGSWIPGGSITGEVVVETYADAVVVPDVSVVLRPGRKVVYVIQDGKALERKVTVGVRRLGEVQIISGLSMDEEVVVDGAGFLADGARIEVVGNIEGEE